MHEFSIASQAAKRVISLAKEKKAKKINKVELAVGELSLLAEEQLKFWLSEILSKENTANDLTITISSVKALIKCRTCGYEGILKPSGDEHHLHPIFLCPECGSSDIQIKEGRDCVIKRVELDI